MPVTDLESKHCRPLVRLAPRQAPCQAVTGLLQCCYTEFSLLPGPEATRHLSSPFHRGTDRRNDIPPTARATAEV